MSALRTSLFGCANPKNVWLAFSSRAHSNLPDAVPWIGLPVRVLGRESLVRMFVAGEHKVCVCRVQVLPECPQLYVARVLCGKAAAEQSVVAKGYDARVCMRQKIMAQPQFLRRPFAAATKRHHVAICIQSDDVPRAKVETVVSGRGIAGLRAPVSKIAGSIRTVVLMVPREQVWSDF